MWHEILHAKSVGLGGKRLTATQSAAMEAINQFVARRTYPEFLSQLGGKAVHKSKIVDFGFGYTNEVGNLMKVFDKYKIDADDAFKFFEKKIVTEKYEDIENILAKFLSDNGIKKAKACVSNLSLHEGMFASFLDKL
jgi:hypothetical protein